jgi:hypothetical protein
VFVISDFWWKEMFCGVSSSLIALLGIWNRYRSLTARAQENACRL